MTLIVGIKCSDGVVLGADGAATVGVLGQPTIRQQTARKLIIVQEHVVVGVSGPVGLGQRFCHEVDALWSASKLSGKKPVESGLIIADALRKHIVVEMNVAGAARNAIGPVAGNDVLSACLVALPCSKDPTLIQFDQQGAPEVATKDLPFVAIGSGEAIADPFLALLRRVCWPGRLPSLQEGVLAACWTLDHAIKTHPGGVAEPMQIVTLQAGGKARELADVDLAEHRQAIEGAEGALTTYMTGLYAAPTTNEVPAPPKP